MIDRRAFLGVLGLPAALPAAPRLRLEPGRITEILARAGVEVLAFHEHRPSLESALIERLRAASGGARSRAPGGGEEPR